MKKKKRRRRSLAERSGNSYSFTASKEAEGRKREEGLLRGGEREEKRKETPGFRGISTISIFYVGMPPVFR